MRQLIKKYKAEGTLNENWFKPFHRMVLIFSFMVLSFLFDISRNLNSTGLVLENLIIITLMLWASYRHIRLSFLFNFKPYASGAIKNLRVTKCRSLLFFLTKIYYIDPVSNKEYISKLFITLIKIKDAPKVGDILECYAIESPKNIAMPNIDKYKNKCSLSNKKGL